MFASQRWGESAPAATFQPRPIGWPSPGLPRPPAGPDTASMPEPHGKGVISLINLITGVITNRCAVFRPIAAHSSTALTQWAAPVTRLHDVTRRQAEAPI